MFILHELINSLVMFTNIICQIFTILITVRIVLSWFGVHPNTSFNELVTILFNVTEPILATFRRLPLQFGGMDLSPIVAFLAIQFANRVIVHGLYVLADTLH